MLIEQITNLLSDLKQNNRSFNYLHLEDEELKQFIKEAKDTSKMLAPALNGVEILVYNFGLGPVKICKTSAYPRLVNGRNHDEYNLTKLLKGYDPEPLSDEDEDY